MKLITGLFRAARKRLVMTHDNDMGQFREKLNELIEQKDTLSDEDIAAKVEELKGFIDDLPEGDDKSKLGRFLEDFKSVKEQDLNVAKEAGKSVADLFEKLDKDAMQDVPEAVGGDDSVAEEEVTEETTPAEEGADGDEVTEEVAEETAAPEPTEEVSEEETEEATDADPDPEYSLEEIYQFIKKRMAEDAAATEGEGDETIEEETEEESGTEDGAADPQSLGEYAKENAKADIDNLKKNCTTDNAPFVAVTMNRNARAEGGLAEMFAAIKNGGQR